MTGSVPIGFNPLVLLRSRMRPIHAQTRRLSRPLWVTRSVASANVLNFFTTLGSRGAATASELGNQRIKVVQEFKKLDADIYGLGEIQNFANGKHQRRLYECGSRRPNGGLAAAAGGYRPDHQCRERGGRGCHAERNRCHPQRHYLRSGEGDTSAPCRPVLSERPEPAQPAESFKPASGAKADQQTFTVVVNHFRSKGTGCGAQVTMSIRAAVTRCASLWPIPFAAGSAPIHADPPGNHKYLLIGDFNAYYGEDPIQAFEGAGGFTDLISLLIGQGLLLQFRFASRLSRSRPGQPGPEAAHQGSVGTSHERRSACRVGSSRQRHKKAPRAQAAYFGANEFSPPRIIDPILSR